MFKSKITGVGHYLPKNVVTNAELTTLMDTSDEWIQERTGIKERRWVKDSLETNAGMGTKAAEMALKNAHLEAKDIDFIVFCTLSPDYFFPGGGVLVQKALNINTIGALDIRNQCSGFVYGLSVADQFIKTGMYKHILVIGSEIQSTGLNISTEGRNVAVIFGDGAGAVVLSKSDNENGILSTHLHSEGMYAEELMVVEPSCTSKDRQSKDPLKIFPVMQGNQVFKHAVTRFPEVINEALIKNNLTIEDLDLLIPHQANLRISQMIQKSMKLGDQQVFSNIHKYGNTTAASIPIALSEAWHEGKIKDGQIICLAAFGSGFTWASALIKW